MTNLSVNDLLTNTIDDVYVDDLYAVTVMDNEASVSIQFLEQLKVKMCE